MGRSSVICCACLAFVLLHAEFISGDVDSLCVEGEREALLKIKDGLTDDYGHLSSWSAEERQKDCCKWRGIQCSNRTRRVTKLDLHVTEFGDDYKPLRGGISNSILQLQHLNYLDLSCNDFHGTIFPNFSGSLNKLRYLNVSYVGFTGTLQNQLRNLSSLRSLDLSFNGFNNVENLEWLSRLSNLRILNFGGNTIGNGSNWLQIVSRLSHLTSLNLSSCHLSNASSLSGFGLNSVTSLSILDLSSNSLSSLIFHWVVSLNSLVHLNISHNNLESTIPNFFGNFCSLHTLDLSGNKLTGELSVFLEHMSECPKDSLEILKLDMNQLHGSVPDFTRFSSLKELSVYTNKLNGSFPKRFSQVSSLAALDVGDNQLTGSLPDLSVFPSMKKLCVVYNKLNGSIPESIGGLSKLELLYVSHNLLQGVITETHFLNLSQLREVYFNDNLLLAFRPNSSWVPPFQLDIIGLRSCNLGPRFPKWLQFQTKYYVLDISNASISDSLPHWFWELPPNLFYLNISHNLLRGVVPDLSSKFDGRPGIDLSSNLLESLLPLLPPNASSLNLSKNKFLGSILSVCNNTSSTLKFLDLSDNMLSGDVPDNCFVNAKQLIVLNLADNNLSGKVPGSVGSSNMLQTFSIRNNSFSGKIPLSLQNCSWLKFLDLGDNRLSGRMPAWIGESHPSLVFLNLRHNMFYGRIPVQVCYLQNILLLDFSHNNISGTIPLCFNNFTLMTRKQLDDSNNYLYNFSASSSEGKNSFEGRYSDSTLIGWKGSTYDYPKIPSILKIINLAENKLSGRIPMEIVSLLGLVGLNLARNELTGMIPQDIGDLTNLDWLDLSENHLSGAIPESMAEINRLSVLNLSYNNLSGKIPQSTQLQSFGESAYYGNPELCGPPVGKKCPGDDRPEVDARNERSEEEEDDDDDEFNRWLYTGLGCGFSVGLWGVLGIVLFVPSWRHAYFQLLEKVTNFFFTKKKKELARSQRRCNGQVHVKKPIGMNHDPYGGDQFIGLHLSL